MISKLTGILDHKDKNFIVLDVGGVGYKIFMSSIDMRSIAIGHDLSLVIETKIREDAFELYGFHNWEEQDFFTKITSVSGIGSKMALKMLSAFSSAQIIEFILADNSSSLTAIPGIGKKIAKRIVIELKDKYKDHVITHEKTNNITQSAIMQDVTSALLNLGYSNVAITNVLANNNFNDNQNFQDIFKIAIRELSHDKQR